MKYRFLLSKKDITLLLFHVSKMFLLWLCGKKIPVCHWELYYQCIAGKGNPFYFSISNIHLFNNNFKHFIFQWWNVNNLTLKFLAGNIVTFEKKKWNTDFSCPRKISPYYCFMWAKCSDFRIFFFKKKGKKKKH
jgi:hypothetical protein